jgi:hypothetical protein
MPNDGGQNVARYDACFRFHPYWRRFLVCRARVFLQMQHPNALLPEGGPADWEWSVSSRSVDTISLGLMLSAVGSIALLIGTGRIFDRNSAKFLLAAKFLFRLIGIWTLIFFIVFSYIFAAHALRWTKFEYMYYLSAFMAVLLSVFAVTIIIFGYSVIVAYAFRKSFRAKFPSGSIFGIIRTALVYPALAIFLLSYAINIDPGFLPIDNTIRQALRNLSDLLNRSIYFCVGGLAVIVGGLEWFRNLAEKANRQGAPVPEN